MMLRFDLDGVPVTKGSWKPGTKGGRIVLWPDNPGEESWAAQTGWAARQALRRPPLPDAITRFVARLDFTLLPPPNRSRMNRRDVDKLARSVLDALTGIVWADDEQVVDLHARKFVVGQIGARPRPGLLAVIEPAYP